MRQAAAIRRASRQARYAMQELDRRGVEDLLVLYGRAAEEVRGRIAAAVDAQEEVPAHRLRELLAQIEAVIDGLAEKRTAMVSQAIDRAAELGVRPYTAQGLGAVGGQQAVLASSAAMRVHQAAVRFVRDFTLADGLTLSDRLWRLDRGAKEALTRAIGQAVVMGQSAGRAAQDFMLRGDKVPGDLVARIAAGKAGELARVADTLTDRNAGAFAQVERVFRTEINRAHGEAYMAAGEGTPGFAGWRFLLSPAHPAPDICFRRGTLVLTRRGEIAIEDVRIGDEALTHLGRWRPVVRLYRSASGPSGLVRLCFPAANSRTQAVVMTPNHPVLTPQGWRAAGDLQTGSAVVCAVPAAAGPRPPGGAGAGCTASPGSGETASAGGAQTSGPVQCGADDIVFTTQYPVIEKLPATGEEVFNLEVQDDHSYVANGLVVHNCDLLAAQNLHGLGQGVYPDRARCPWPAHPNTLSFVVMVFKEDVGKAERAGKETALQALQRLAPEIREGALGKTKADYFDKGVLSTGMIRAPLRAVRQRLERTAERAHAPLPDALPGFARAVLPAAKISGYVLNTEHPKGQHKARVIASALGFTRDSADQFSQAIHAALPLSPAKARPPSPHGTMYSVDMRLTGPKGSAIVRTGWIVEPGSDIPRLTSAYVKPGKS